MDDLSFFSFTPPDNNLLLEGFYDPVLVLFSVLVAMFSAYAALLVSQHVSNTTTRRERNLWMAIGGLCLGFGIWAMHFVGMLAFNLPCDTSYDATLTALSTLPGVMASVLLVRHISRPTRTPWQMVRGGLLLGAGVGAMHYAGMAAMRLNGLILYHPQLFALSILVAVVLGSFALWLKHKLADVLGQRTVWANALGAGVLGLAVSGMHYTAMLAAYFVRDDQRLMTSGIEPAFLALVVLTITVLIVLVTLVAAYIELPSLLSLSRSFRLTGTLVLGWVVMAWLGVNNQYDRLSANLYTQESQLAVQQVAHMTNVIEQRLRTTQGVPQVVAQDANMLTMAKRFAPAGMPVFDSPAKRQHFLESQALVKTQNQRLAQIAKNLGADHIFVLNSAGDCVASSNGGQPSSFVGFGFSDREYYRLAKNKQNGQQYAVGRISSAPGLYFSSPLVNAGQFVGAVVVKTNLSHFAAWTSQAKAFLTDANGVIILANEKSWEYQAMPLAQVHRIPAESLLLQYRKSTFEPLHIAQWGKDPRFPGLVVVGNSPSPRLITSKTLSGSTITVVAAHPFDSLVRLESERHWLFFLMTAAGTLLIVAVAAVGVHLRESRAMESEHRIAATAFETQQGMIITDAQGLILRVNRAFTAITGYTDQEVLGQNPRILQSGQHDSLFYAAMWDTIERVGAWQGEIWSKRKNGEVYPEWLLITAVKNQADAVTHYVGTFADITLRKQAESEINNLAFYDPLTSLPNRRLLLDRLQHALLASARTGKHGALLFIDLDNFKDLNDNRGHQMGDLLLKQVALRLGACVREEDTTARLGGDEFVVMLENMSQHTDAAAEQAQSVGEKILHALNQPYQLDGYAHHSTPSIGVTLFSDKNDSIDDMLKRADMAMYQAKAAGRNTLRFFDPQMQAVVSTRAALEDDLREAIQKNQFLLHYQPQVAGAGRLTGTEVLLRWRHPSRGMVSPADFIPLAEASGLILPLGLWVLETACQQLATWAQHTALAHLTIAVNVSARQFRQADFVAQVMAVLARTGANPLRLKLELTESLLVNDVEDIIAKMTHLKAQGVGFSLDDFGTGYSSLSYLKRLPLDQLKIDQGFVRNILSDPNDAAIAKMVIALAESLGLAVIAEGVEMDAQREFLAHLGCHTYQGYLYSRPLPIDEFEAWAHRASH